MVELTIVVHRGRYRRGGAVHPINLVERWFAGLTEKQLRRGSFDSVRRLEAAITRWLQKWNDNARPFRWTKSAADNQTQHPPCCTYLRYGTLIWNDRVN